MRDLLLFLFVCLSIFYAMEYYSGDTYLEKQGVVTNGLSSEACFIETYPSFNTNSKITVKKTYLNNSSAKDQIKYFQSGYFQISRLLLMLFLLFCLIVILVFIKDFFTQEETANIDAMKMRFRQGIEAEIVETLKIKLAKKDRELTNYAIALEEKNMMLKKVKSSLIDLSFAPSDTVRKKLKPLSRSIDQNIEMQQDWLHFKQQVAQVHPEFVAKIKKKFPHLNSNSLRLCVYLRLNFTTQEIANLLHINSSSVQKAKYRLRKKLNLSREERIESFLESI